MGSWLRLTHTQKTLYNTPVVPVHLCKSVAETISHVSGTDHSVPPEPTVPGTHTHTHSTDSQHRTLSTPFTTAPHLLSD